VGNGPAFRCVSTVVTTTVRGGVAALAAAAVACGLAAVPAVSAVPAGGAVATPHTVRAERPAAPADNRVVDTVLRAEPYDYRRQNWRVREADGLPRWLRISRGRLTGTAPRLGTWRISLQERGVRKQRGEVRRTTLVLRAVTPRAAPGTVLVTRGIDGGPANGGSGSVTLSGDGGTAVFSSAATNLVPGSQQPDVARLYVWDAATDRVSLLHPEPWAQVEGISADGRRVLLDLTAGLFLLDRADGSLTQVAPRAVGAALTEDGLRVLYQDRYHELASPPPRLLEWTAATGATRTLVPDVGTRTFAGMSGDGRHAVMVDYERNTLLDTTTGGVHDLGRLGTELGSTFRAEASYDGRLVSVLGSGLPGGSGHGGDPVGGVHDTVLGTSRGPSRGNLGAAITPDARHYAVATSRRPLRVVDTLTGARTSPFTARPSGEEHSASLNDDASRVAYASDAHDLMRGTRRGVANVFIWVRPR
jgi:hypothetical protein